MHIFKNLGLVRLDTTSIDVKPCFWFFFSPPLHLLWDDMGRYLGQPVAFQLNISPCSMVGLWCFVYSVLGLASVMCCTPILMLCLNNFLWVFHCHLGTTLLVLPAVTCSYYLFSLSSKKISWLMPRWFLLWQVLILSTGERRFVDSRVWVMKEEVVGIIFTHEKDKQMKN